MSNNFNKLYFSVIDNICNITSFALELEDLRLSHWIKYENVYDKNPIKTNSAM